MNEVWHVEEQVLKEALAPHPKLKAAIFPPPAKEGSPAETQDISLYQLLQVPHMDMFVVLLDLA